MSQEKKFIDYLANYQKMILKVAGIYCRNEETRKDLIQEIILQLWKSFPKYDSTFSISTWTYRIALNVSISYVRKTVTRDKVLRNYQRNIEVVHIEEEGIQDQLKQLYDAIQFLKPFDKAIVSLHLEGCKNKEIAEVLGITPSNVSTKLSRIKQQLKNNFNTPQQKQPS